MVHLDAGVCLDGESQELRSGGLFTAAVEVGIDAHVRASAGTGEVEVARNRDEGRDLPLREQKEHDDVGPGSPKPGPSVAPHDQERAE